MAMQRHPGALLDDLLTALAGGDAAGAGRIVADHPDLAALAAVARAVGDVALVGPSPAVRARHVQAVMDEADRLAGPAGVAAPPRRRRHLRRSLAAVAAVLAVLVVAAPVTAAVASTAQPGQALYGTKLFVERVELAARRDLSSQEAFRLKLASERLREIDRLIAAGKAGRVAGVLQHLSDQEGQLAVALRRLARRGRLAPAAVQDVRAFVAQHEATLRSLGTLCAQATLRGPPCVAIAGEGRRVAEILRAMS